MKILLLGAEFFHAYGETDGQTDRQTDMTKLVVAFHNFANVPKDEMYQASWKNLNNISHILYICVCVYDYP
jgi:hypothetical protein